MNRIKTNRGITFIDVVVGTALLSFVFVGIIGIFQSSIQLTHYTKAKIGALALANQAIESSRSLAYDDVGTVSGIPSGVIPQTETISVNGIEYTRRMVVLYVDDPADGVGVADSNAIASDYKKVKSEVSWDLRGVTHSIAQVTNIVPNGIETLAGGGTLIINVFDSTAQPVAGASVRVINASSSPPIDVTLLTSADGKVWFPGSPATSDYEVIVSKAGYSTAQTYDTDAINVLPNPGHQSVLAAQTTQVSFAIDEVGSKLISTFEPVQDFAWNDLFVDVSNISIQSSTTVSGGEVVLIDDAAVYRSPGTVRSLAVAHPQLVTWKSISWNDVTPPQTQILYQLHYDNGGLALVPDIDLPGNAAGFDSSATSSVNISALSTTTYATLALFATLSTTDASTTPSIQDWQFDYTAGPIPLGSIDFTMRGAKEIGENASAETLYKYDADLSTDVNGVVHIDPLEWDVYTITVDGAATGYDISRICEPQPVAMPANADITTDIQLVPDSAHSLLVTVDDSGDNHVNNASIRLFLGGYDETRTTAGCGQVFFEGLTSGTYDLEATASGYTYTLIEDIDISGVTNETVIIND